jgi:hypothetical protein
MEEMHLLFIEDEPAQIQSYEDVIDSYNKKNTPKITYEICKDYAEGKKALETPYYDAAIIDLKLSTGEELEGRQLVDDVHGKIRIPIVIYSGSIAQIDDLVETVLLKKRNRTDSLDGILKEVAEIYSTGITKMLRPEGAMDKLLTEIFWNHLVKDLERWMKHNNPRTLQRYVFSHFQEHLEVNGAGDFEEYHPAEVYITPPIKRNIHTGDLISFEGDYFVVLTPACDMVINYIPNDQGVKIPHRKADSLMVAQVKKFDIETMCLDKNGKVSKGKINECVTNKSYRYHYLPPLNAGNGFLIDFQALRTLSFDPSIERVATISSSFIKDIISRFSLYYARQGQPTFEQNKIVDQLFAQASK